MQRIRLFLIIPILGLTILASTTPGQVKSRSARPSIVESMSAVPSFDSYAPTPFSLPRVKRNPTFKVYAAEPKRVPDPHHPELKPEQQEIIAHIYWPYEGRSNLLTIASHPNGQIYQLVRDTHRGRDIFGFGEDFLKNIELDGYKVTRKGEIDFTLPYVIQSTGKNIHIETFREAKWPEMLYSLAEETMKCRILPKLTGGPICKVDVSKPRVTMALNFPQLKDNLTRYEGGGIYKRDMADINDLLKIHAEVEKKKAKEAKQAAKKNKPTKDTMAGSIKEGNE